MVVGVFVVVVILVSAGVGDVGFIFPVVTDFLFFLLSNIVSH